MCITRDIYIYYGSGHYAKMLMAGDYTHEEFESPAKISKAGIINYR